MDIKKFILLIVLLVAHSINIFSQEDSLRVLNSFNYLKENKNIIFSFWIKEIKKHKKEKKHPLLSLIKERGGINEIPIYVSTKLYDYIDISWFRDSIINSGDLMGLTYEEIDNPIIFNKRLPYESDSVVRLNPSFFEINNTDSGYFLLSFSNPQRKYIRADLNYSSNGRRSSFFWDFISLLFSFNEDGSVKKMFYLRLIR